MKLSALILLALLGVAAAASGSGSSGDSGTDSGTDSGGSESGDDSEVVLEKGYKVAFVGKSPKFKLFTGDKFALVTISSIEEIDATGKKTANAITGLASAKELAFSAPKKSPDTDALEVTFSGNLGSKLNNAGVFIRALVFNSTSTFTDPDTNQTVTVNENNLKWTIKVDNWPFLDKANKLTLGISMSGPSGTEAEEEKDEEASPDASPEPKKKEKRAKLGNFAMDFPTECFVDGASAESEVVIDKKTTTFTFPYFENSLVYDPTMGPDDSDSVTDSASALGHAAIAVIFALFTVLF